MASDYSRDKFYIRASDDNGHDKKINLHLPTNVSHELWIYVERDSNPFQSPTDIFRDALVHELHYLSELEPENEEVRRWVRMRESVVEFERQKALLERQRNVVDTVRQSLLDPMQAQMVTDLMLAEALASVDIPELRDDLARMIERRVR